MKVHEKSFALIMDEQECVDSQAHRKKKAKKRRGIDAGKDDSLDNNNKEVITKGEGHDYPKRPLSAYNFFFREKRAELLQLNLAEYDPNSREKRVHQRTHGQMPFVTMAKTISDMWKLLSAEQRKKYQDLANTDRERYYSQKQHIIQVERVKARNTKYQAAKEITVEQRHTLDGSSVEPNYIRTGDINNESIIDAQVALEASLKRPHAVIMNRSPNLSTQGDITSTSLQQLLDQRDREWMTFLYQHRQQQRICFEHQNQTLFNNRGHLSPRGDGVYYNSTSQQSDETMEPLSGLNKCLPLRNELISQLNVTIPHNQPSLLQTINKGSSRYRFPADATGPIAAFGTDNWIPQMNVSIPQQHTLNLQAVIRSSYPVNATFASSVTPTGPNFHTNMGRLNSTPIPLRDNWISTLNATGLPLVSQTSIPSQLRLSQHSDVSYPLAPLRTPISLKKTADYDCLPLVMSARQSEKLLSPDKPSNE